ncbi:Family of unknown function (DUF500) [Seminavis robusta]|uniref:Ysc84 actin-binding domain-containing protein n=1 Tax=Seminavis robusta TaxID=568900 RepID=A0A9N8EM52_9STRA|nr:Family of unknown function (DUF500) [Seminavis robusta]|eukprot:Sro1207_g252410.1 Family of unknown function (DUF500) (176) ;mRNA; r:555-1082
MSVSSVEQTINLAKNQGMAPEFESCHAYAVFPSITSVAIGIGGKGGTGEVFLKDGMKLGDATYAVGTLGGFGAENIKQIVFLENAEATQKFTSGKFELKYDYHATIGGASAGVSVGTTIGAQGNAGDGGSHGVAYMNGVKVVAITSKGLYICGPIAGGAFAELGAGKYMFTPISA